MGFWDYAILTILAGAVALALWRKWKKSDPCCSGDCAGCNKCGRE